MQMRGIRAKGRTLSAAECSGGLGGEAPTQAYAELKPGSGAEEGREACDFARLFSDYSAEADGEIEVQAPSEGHSESHFKKAARTSGDLSFFFRLILGRLKDQQEVASAAELKMTGQGGDTAKANLHRDRKVSGARCALDCWSTLKPCAAGEPDCACNSAFKQQAPTEPAAAVVGAEAELS